MKKSFWSKIDPVPLVGQIITLLVQLLRRR